MIFDTSILVSIITAVSGVTTGSIGLFWAVHTYKKGQTLKRQEILFPLIKEFDDNTSLLHVAREILDDFALLPKHGWMKTGYAYNILWDEIKGDYKPLKKFLREELGLEWVENEVFIRRTDREISIGNKEHSVLLKLYEQKSTGLKVSVSVDDHIIYYFLAYLSKDKVKLLWRYYHISNLQNILRDHTTSTIVDEGEMEIRSSFDIILDFFGRIGYLVKVGLMEKEETFYFLYYIKKIVENESIMNYVFIYKFGLFAFLIKELGLSDDKKMDEIIPRI
jgi:hypothetical protein